MESSNQPTGRSSGARDEFSVVVLASDLGIDAQSLLGNKIHEYTNNEEEDEWYDCRTALIDAAADFSDLDRLQAFRVKGSDKQNRTILRIVGKYFPAPVICAERLKMYLYHKIATEIPEGPFCIVYFHSCVCGEDNSPGIFNLRDIYEELPTVHKRRLETVYFVHPGLRSRLTFATVGRLLSEGLYSKIKYVSRLQYLWDDIKKGQVEIPDFVAAHDDVLEHRPLTDYGIEPDVFPLHETANMGYSFTRRQERWNSGTY